MLNAWPVTARQHRPHQVSAHQPGPKSAKARSLHNSLRFPIPPFLSPTQVPLPSNAPPLICLRHALSHITLTLIVLHQQIPHFLLLQTGPFQQRPLSLWHTTPSLLVALHSVFYWLSRPSSWPAHHLLPAHHSCTSLLLTAEGPPSSLLETSSPFHLSNESLETVPRPARYVRLKAVPHQPHAGHMPCGASAVGGDCALCSD